LREATKEFDREFVGDTISVTVEKRLLARTDRLAKKLHVARAVLVARGLQAVLSEEAPVG
jgi:metal-responsive CopG/Arc/MetJ family transcriptional regulator